MFFLTDGSKSVVAEVQLDEAGVGGHNASAQVLQGGRDLGLHAPRKHVLPVGPSELGVHCQGLA